MATLKDMFISYKNVTPQDMFLEPREEQIIEDPMFPSFERLELYNQEQSEEINDPGVFEDPGVDPVIPLLETKKESPIKAPSNFKLQMYKYLLKTGDFMDETKLKFLTKIAKLESDFRQKAKASGSTASGYFGVIKSGRKDLGSDYEYLNNPDLLFEAASRLYDERMALVAKLMPKAKELGLTQFLVLYGMWFRPKSMLDYINSGGKDDGFRDSLGSSLKSILKKAEA